MKRPLFSRARLALEVLRGRAAGARVLEGEAAPAAERLRELTSLVARTSNDRQAAGIVWRAEQRRRQRELVAQVAAGVWKGGEQSRLTLDWMPGILPADDELRYDVRQLRARARELARNKGTVHHYKRMVSANVVGHVGPRLQPKVKLADGSLDRPTNERILEAWRSWTRGRVTIDRRMAWVPFLWLVAETARIDGEVFVRLYRDAENNPHGLALQIIDADYLDETMTVLPGSNRNEIRMGIEVDQYGGPLFYNFWRDQRMPFSVPVQHERVPADQVIHLMWPDRPNQTRGVTAAHAAMFPMQMLAGYMEAELVASRIAAAKTGWFTSKEGAVGEMGSADKPTIMEANPGRAEALPPGWTFEPWDPQHPTVAFPEFMRSGMREVATGLDVSYNALANDLTGVNFSSYRSGLLNERDMWRMLQTWLVLEVCSPIYEAWLGMSLLRGALELPSRDFRRYLDHEFQPRGWPWVDPEKDVNAAAIAIGQGLSSRTRVLSEAGESLEETLQELADEKALAEKIGVELAPPPGAPAETAPDPGGDGGDAGDNPGPGGNGDEPGPPAGRRPRAPAMRPGMMGPGRNGRAAAGPRFLTVD